MERLGERRVLVERVLEPRREVDLRRLDRREVMEQLIGQRRGTVLDGTRQPVRPRHITQPPEHVEVELDLRHAATGQRDATV